jgi:serine/threonine protein kinase
MGCFSFTSSFIACQTTTSESIQYINTAPHRSCSRAPSCHATANTQNCLHTPPNERHAHLFTLYREEDVEDVMAEIALLRACQSPNIVSYHGAALIPGTTRIMLAMELMALSAAELASPPGLPEPQVAYVLREVLNALVYLHSEDRMHRDIKAANVLLSSSGMVKVSDLGVAAQLGGTMGAKRRTFVGSPLWMAPEVIEQSPDVGGGQGGKKGGKDGYDEAADVWSLGITAIEVGGLFELQWSSTTESSSLPLCVCE